MQESECLKLKTPYTMIVAGQTGCGKTEFVAKLIKNQALMHDPPFERIIIAYGMMQKVYSDLLDSVPNLELSDGFPNDYYQAIKNDEKVPTINTLLILDDLMMELATDNRLPELFTRMRHKKISTILMVQNFFFRSKHMTTVTRNAQYLAIYPNPRDMTMISTLSRQMFPHNKHFLSSAFEQATRKPYGYLFVDIKPGTDERFRLRHDIFPGETCIVYRPA